MVGSITAKWFLDGSRERKPDESEKMMVLQRLQWQRVPLIRMPAVFEALN